MFPGCAICRKPIHPNLCRACDESTALTYRERTAAGVVVACDENVQRFRPGDRVACTAWFGSLVERMTATTANSARLPEMQISLLGQQYNTATSRPGMAWSIARGCRPAKVVLAPGAIRRSADCPK
jgi:NADPH:quinone reductase-like Zn-dependent oxidoreductase